jgi:hypothetical protein
VVRPSRVLLAFPGLSVKVEVGSQEPPERETPFWTLVVLASLDMAQWKR